MSRAVLPEAHIHPTIRAKVAELHASVLAEVQTAIAHHPVVLLSMKGNPFCKRARKSLQGAGMAFHELEYGGYLSQWRRRNALKMWSGWPTFPMLFVRGTLIGGAEDLDRLLQSGELKALLAA